MGPDNRPNRAGSLHLLLIEDNPGDARLVEETLKDVGEGTIGGRGAGAAGTVLSHEPSLDSGLDRLDEEDVDVLLLDLGLPESTGLETLTRARERSADVPIVVLTGRPETELGVEAVARGAREYLVKDAVTPEVLARTIEYAIERERIERELRRRTEELAILNHLTRHDIKNDVSLVVGRASELRESVGPDDERLVDELLAASNHVLQLTRSVEDVVESIRAGDQDDLRPVGLWPVVLSEVETARSLYDGAIIETGAGDEAVEVRANELLSSVFANLLGNAVRYNDEEAPEIDVTMTVDGEFAMVRIADNGPGVPEYRRAQLFDAPEPGFEAGTSVGLYLVGRLVAQYGGSVDVENRTDGGAAFTVSLPLV